MATNKRITVALTPEEMDFITWLAKRDKVSVGRELRQIFYTELRELIDLYEEERKQEQTGVLNQIAKEQSTLGESLKAWGKAIEKRGYIN